MSPSFDHPLSRKIDSFLPSAVSRTGRLNGIVIAGIDIILRTLFEIAFSSGVVRSLATE